MTPPSDSFPRYNRHFGGLARRYDALRRDPSDENIDLLVREGDLTGRSVLDIGCGTGRVAAVLSERYGARVHGVDPSDEMLAVARDRNARGVEVSRAPAEALPFTDASFERAVMQLVVHLVDRPQAFAEARRVLAGHGRLVICTVDPDGVDDFWLSDLFPSYPGIDRRRFTAPGLLYAELRQAGFSAAATRRFIEPLRYERAEALAMLRGRFASSFALIDDAEYAAGLERAERTLGETVMSTLRLVVVTARM